MYSYEDRIRAVTLYIKLGTLWMARHKLMAEMERVRVQGAKTQDRGQMAPVERLRRARSFAQPRKADAVLYRTPHMHGQKGFVQTIHGWRFCLP